MSLRRLQEEVKKTCCSGAPTSSPERAARKVAKSQSRRRELNKRSPAPVASFDASIKLLLEAQQVFKKVAALERRLEKLQNAATKLQIKNFLADEEAATKLLNDRPKLSKTRKAKKRERLRKRNPRLSSATEPINQRNLKLERAGALEVVNCAKAIGKLNDIAAAFWTDPNFRKSWHGPGAYFINPK